jgi:hypothetical protein
MLIDHVCVCVVDIMYFAVLNNSIRGFVSRRRRAQPVAHRPRLATQQATAAISGPIASSFNFYKRQADINDRAIMVIHFRKTQLMLLMVLLRLWYVD